MQPSRVQRAWQQRDETRERESHTTLVGNARTGASERKRLQRGSACARHADTAHPRVTRTHASRSRTRIRARGDPQTDVRARWAHAAHRDRPVPSRRMGPKPNRERRRRSSRARVHIEVRGTAHDASLSQLSHSLTLGLRPRAPCAVERRPCAEPFFTINKASHRIIHLT